MAMMCERREGGGLPLFYIDSRVRFIKGYIYDAVKALLNKCRRMKFFIKSSFGQN